MRTKDYFITAIALFVSFLGYSVPQVPPGPGNGGLPPPPKGLPLDENITFLFALAILLAGYQLIIFRKNKKTQSEI